MTRSRVYLNEHLFWALKPEAEAAINDLVSQGWDKDLAFATVERLWGEEAMFALPEPESDDERRAEEN